MPKFIILISLFLLVLFACKKDKQDAPTIYYQPVDFLLALNEDTITSPYEADTVTHPNAYLVDLDGDALADLKFTASEDISNSLSASEREHYLTFEIIQPQFRISGDLDTLLLCAIGSGPGYAGCTGSPTEHPIGVAGKFVSPDIYDNLSNVTMGKKQVEGTLFYSFYMSQSYVQTSYSYGPLHDNTYGYILVKNVVEDKLYALEMERKADNTCGCRFCIYLKQVIEI